MGMLLSICFKGNEAPGPPGPQYHMKKQKSNVTRQKSSGGCNPGKQHLLDASGGHTRGGYSTMGGPSPQGPPQASPRAVAGTDPGSPRSPWNRPPPSPDCPPPPGTFMTPPSSPREKEVKGPGGSASLIGRSFSLKASKNPAESNGRKRSFRSKSTRK